MANESDYRYVFSLLENQIKTAPNRFVDPQLDKYLSDLTCQLSTDYCNQIRIYIIDEPNFNAHMFPNGALIMNTGLLLRLENQAQLAYIISHELAHYAAKHGTRKLNFAKSINIQRNQTSDFNPLKPLAELKGGLSKNSFSQQLEHEADLYSIRLLSENKFSLAEVARMFEDLKREKAAVNKVNRGGFFSSHPGTDQRIKLFSQNSSQQSTALFQLEDTWQNLKTRYINSWFDSELSKREFKSTKVLLNRLKSHSSNPTFFDYYLGEIYRKQGGQENAKKAIFYYQSYLEKKPAMPLVGVYKGIGQSYLELNNPDQAKFYYLKYINQVPKPGDAHIVQNQLIKL